MFYLISPHLTSLNCGVESNLSPLSSVGWPSLRSLASRFSPLFLHADCSPIFCRRIDGVENCASPLPAPADRARKSTLPTTVGAAVLGVREIPAPRCFCSTILLLPMEARVGNRPLQLADKNGGGKS